MEHRQLWQELDEKWTVWNSRSAKVENNTESILTLDKLEGEDCSVTFTPQENKNDADGHQIYHTIDSRCFGIPSDGRVHLRREPINRTVEVDIILNDNCKDMVVIIHDNAGGMTNESLKGELTQ